MEKMLWELAISINTENHHFEFFFVLNSTNFTVVKKSYGYFLFAHVFILAHKYLYSAQ